MESLYIDDPVSAIPLHGMCGIWGLIFVGFFATDNFLNQVGRCAIVPLRCGTALHCCTAALWHRCTAALLYRYTAVPLH